MGLSRTWQQTQNWKPAQAQDEAADTEQREAQTGREDAPVICVSSLHRRGFPPLCSRSRIMPKSIP
jgi:hypothetical protein